MQIIHAEMGLYLLNGQRADHAYADPHSHLVPFTWLCHFIHHQLSEMHLLMLYICITWCSFTTPLHTTSVNSSSPADCQNINSPEFVCSSVYLPLVSREKKKLTFSREEKKKKICFKGKKEKRRMREGRLKKPCNCT